MPTASAKEIRQVFGLPDVPVSDIPEELKVFPRLDKCKKCGRTVMWCRRSDADEIGSPIEPGATIDGNLAVIGFTRSLRLGIVVPHVRAIENTNDLPDLTSLPAWAERKRWLHHGPFCKRLVRVEDLSAPPRTIDEDPELTAAFHRMRDQASRQRFVGEFLRRVVMKMPMWTPSAALSDVLTQYELGTINTHKVKAALTYETGLIADFTISERERRRHRVYPRRRP